MYKKKLTLISLIIIALIVFSSINISIEAKNIFPRRDNLKRYLDNSYSQLYCVMPSNAIVGQPIKITIQAWDWAERICKKPFKSTISFISTDEGATLPESFSFRFRDFGTKSFENKVIFSTPGIHYVIVNDSQNGIYSVSNPVKVTEEESEYKWYWGELHCHSENSDGRGYYNHNYRYARDISMLDFCAYTDHINNWWIPWESLKLKRLFGFQKAKQAVNKFYDSGKFVTILAYEYSSSLGHHNVYFNTVDAVKLDPIIKYRDKIVELWSLLKDWKNETGYDVFTVPHHLLTANIPWNSSYYDPEMVPLVEIFQYRGSSEMNNDRGNPVPFLDNPTNESGHSVQDGLVKGYKFGFIAASDDHEGHPGHHLPIMPAYLTEPNSYRVFYIYLLYTGFRSKLEFFQKLTQNNVSKQYKPGGLTGVKAKELSRKEIFNALKDRRCIAVTNVNRMLVDFTINDQGVGNGSEVYVPDVNTPRIINCSVAGTAPIANVTVVKNNETFYVAEGYGSDLQNLSNYMINFSIVDTEPITGVSWDEEHNTSGRDFYYIRVLQTNKGVGWIGPIWVNPFDTI